MSKRVTVLIYVSYEFGINMIAKKLKDSWCVINWVVYIKLLNLMVNVI